MNWHTISHLPDDEPAAHNLAQYAHPQLIAGSSEDGRFIYDAIYHAAEQTFVLTMMDINAQWGFIEHECRAYPKTRAELSRIIAQFHAHPSKTIAQLQAA